LRRGDIPSIGGLTSFVAAAERESFTRAANDLNLSQGAVSRHIRELEGHLGIRLFDRVRQRVILTEAGRLFLAHIKQPLDELAHAARRLEAFSDGTVLKLAVVPAFAARWLLPRLPGFQKRNSGITVHVTGRQRPVDFGREPFDATIAFDPSRWAGAVVHHLIDMHMVAACSPKLNAGHFIKQPADIAKFPLLHKMSRPNRWAEWMADAGVSMGSFVQGHSYPQLAMVAEAATAGFGIALLPYNLFQEEFETKQLELVPNQPYRTKISYYLIVPQARAGSDAMQTLTDWLIAEARGAEAPPACLLSARQRFG